jgi:hypothetical protein
VPTTVVRLSDERLTEGDDVLAPSETVKTLVMLKGAGPEKVTVLGAGVLVGVMRSVGVDVELAEL